MSPAARDHELLGELIRRASGLFHDVVPADAQAHLLNAQRELLTAIVIMYEHQSGARRTGSGGLPPRSRSRAPGPRRGERSAKGPGKASDQSPDDPGARALRKIRVD